MDNKSAIKKIELEKGTINMSIVKQQATMEARRKYADYLHTLTREECESLLMRCIFDGQMVGSTKLEKAECNEHVENLKEEPHKDDKKYIPNAGNGYRSEMNQPDTKEAISATLPPGSPPKPKIYVKKDLRLTFISWSLPDLGSMHAEIDSYQVLFCQDIGSVATSGGWQPIEAVKSEILPMTITLQGFPDGSRYYFIVRAIDEYQRPGPYSNPATWSFD